MTTKSQTDNTELDKEVRELIDYWDFSPLQDEDSRIERVKSEILAIVDRQIQAKLQEQDIKSRIDEWQTVLEAKITHGGSPAPFNPEGLPISTPATEQMTELLHQHAQNRLTELRSKA